MSIYSDVLSKRLSKKKATTVYSQCALLQVHISNNIGFRVCQSNKCISLVIRPFIPAMSTSHYIYCQTISPTGLPNGRDAKQENNSCKHTKKQRVLYIYKTIYVSALITESIKLQVICRFSKPEKYGHACALKVGYLVILVVCFNFSFCFLFNFLIFMC